MTNSMDGLGDFIVMETLRELAKITESYLDKMTTEDAEQTKIILEVVEDLGAGGAMVKNSVSHIEQHQQT